MKPIIGDTEFLTNLDDWLFKNTQPSAKWIHQNKLGIPVMFRNYSNFLYRGMFVDADFLMDVDAGKVSFKTFTSWAKDEKVAIRFASDTGASGSKAQGTVRIIIKKKITVAKQVLDIDTFATYMGVKATHHDGYG